MVKELVELTGGPADKRRAEVTPGQEYVYAYSKNNRVGWVSLLRPETERTVLEWIRTRTPFVNAAYRYRNVYRRTTVFVTGKDGQRLRSYEFIAALDDRERGKKAWQEKYEVQD